MKSNYDKFPSVKISGYDHACRTGWAAVCETLGAATAEKNTETERWVLETYPGTDDEEILRAFGERRPEIAVFHTREAFPDPAEIERMCYPDVTDDRVFGFMTRLTVDRFFDPERLSRLRGRIRAARGRVLVYGVGAAYVAEKWDLFVYADLARWEIQRRMRKQPFFSIGADQTADFPALYKRGYFVDWRVADRVKQTVLPACDFYLDTNRPGEPKLISGAALFAALEQCVRRPFRVVPFFDPGPWGGQWMMEVCDLDRSAPNYAWCFDCVPEENSLLLDFGSGVVEIPSVNLVFFQPKSLLGEKVYARFGAEFPIRFDFLDTINGGNLSLQVHPLTGYIREHFGMFYTQDESYYLLDAGEDACVYLGWKTGVEPAAVVAALQAAQAEGPPFDADRYVERRPVKKHDHVLIPAGTVHCSGKNCMVLEISATPYIFTFKLWDWGRLGLDGRPRPIHLEHGKANIDWSRSTEWVDRHLVHRVEKIAEGPGWVEERTGLHETEFIETRRHWFSEKVTHHTEGNVHVLNLIEGREVLVESPDGAFAAFVVHFAETFIVPAAVGAYSIRPFGESEGRNCGTIQAFVRN